MAAVARSCPQPIERHILVPVKRKYQYVRMREMLAGALRPLGGYNNTNGDGGGLFSGGGTPQAVAGGQQPPRGFPPGAGLQRKGSVNIGGAA